MQFFVEAHYYDGGFKTELVPNGLRPSFLPSPEVIGLKSTEAELAAGEFAIEIASFAICAEPISWIACYTRGRDLQHGDRGSYCGVGIWVVGATLKHARHLVNVLAGATENLAATAALSTETRSKLVSFVNELPNLGWFVPYKGAEIPKPARENTFSTTSYLMLSDHSKSGFDLVSVDMLGHFLVMPYSHESIRRLYFLGRKSRIFVQPTEQFTFKNALTYAEHIIHSIGNLATASAKTSQAIEANPTKMAVRQ